MTNNIEGMVNQVKVNTCIVLGDEQRIQAELIGHKEKILIRKNRVKRKTSSMYHIRTVTCSVSQQHSGKGVDLKVTLAD